MARKSKNLSLKPSKSNYLKLENNNIISKKSKRNRKTKGLDLQNIVYIYFNSLETEKNYFEGYKNKFKDHNVDCCLCLKNIQNKGGKSPKELLKYTIEDKKKLPNNIKEREYNFWIVFDKDNYQDIHSVVCEAEKNNISVAFSNPCFELWFLNHFDYHQSSLTISQCMELFKTKFRKEFRKEYKKNDSENFDILYNKIEKAIKNSQKQYNSIKEQIKNSDKQNPCTFVYRLVEILEKKLKNIDSWC